MRILEPSLRLLCGGWIARDGPRNSEKTRAETGREGCMMGTWPRSSAVAVERRWVPGILKKGTNRASRLVGCGVKEGEECTI